VPTTRRRSQSVRRGRCPHLSSRSKWRYWHRRSESEDVHEILGEAEFPDELNHLHELSRFSERPSVQPRGNRDDEGDVRHALRGQRSSAGWAEASLGEYWPWDEAEPRHPSLVHNIETSGVVKPFETLVTDAIEAINSCPRGEAGLPTP